MKPGKIITLFIVTIIGIIFLISISTISNPQVNPETGSDIETAVNLTEGEHVLGIISEQADAQCQDFGISENSTGDEILGEGNYTFYSTNCTYIIQTDSPYVDTLGDVEYSYSYEGDEYIENSTARGMVNTVLILLVLIILSYIIANVLKMFGEEKIN